MNKHRHSRGGMTSRLRPLFLLGLLACLSLGASAQSNRSAGLASADLSAVLSKCISITGIEKFHPGVAKTFSVLQGPVALPQDLALTAKGHSIAILAHKDARPDAYYQFRDIQSGGQTAAVVMNYFYHDKSNKMKALAVNLQLRKSGAAWTIVTSEIKELI